MRTKRLGNSDLVFSRIGLGTFAIGGLGWIGSWGPQDDMDSIHAIQRALDLGVNWIDTAPVYGFGHAEEIVGKAISGHREKVLIATKCGLLWKEGNPVPYGRLKAESVRREVENSLRRLKTDFIDLYMIHWPDPVLDIEEGWTEISKCIQEGKVRYGGASNFNVEQMKKLQAIHPITSLEPPYSMLARDIENEILRFSGEQKIGVIAYSPMHMGLLSGKFSKQRAAKLSDMDLRKNNDNFPMFQEPALTINLEFVEKLRPVAESNGKTVAQLAIAWVLRRPEITSAIVGTRNPSQIEETIQAADWELPVKIVDAIETLLVEREEKFSKR